MTPRNPMHFSTQTTANWGFGKQNGVDIPAFYT